MAAITAGTMRPDPGVPTTKVVLPISWMAQHDVSLTSIPAVRPPSEDVSVEAAEMELAQAQADAGADGGARRPPPIRQRRSPCAGRGSCPRRRAASPCCTAGRGTAPGVGLAFQCLGIVVLEPLELASAALEVKNALRGRDLLQMVHVCFYRPVAAFAFFSGRSGVAPRVVYVLHARPPSCRRPGRAAAPPPTAPRRPRAPRRRGGSPRRAARR